METVIVLSKAKQEKLVQEVAHALSRNGYMHFLNLETLEVISLNEKINFIEEQINNIEEAPDNYLQILPYSDAARQALRRRFVLKLGDETIRKQLLSSIDGYDPNSAFRKTLKQYSDIEQQWLTYKQTHFVVEAQKWLYENGLGKINII
jgi:hypothetical protein